MHKAMLTQSLWQKNVIFLWNEKEGSGNTGVLTVKKLKKRFLIKKCNTNNI